MIRRRRTLNGVPGADAPPSDSSPEDWTEGQPGARGGDDDAWNSNLQSWGDVPSRIAPVTIEPSRTDQPGFTPGPPVTARQGPALTGSALIIYPMWLYPSQSAQRYFTEIKNTTVLAGAVNQVIAGLSVTAGEGRIGVLNWVGLTVNNPLSTMTLTFAIFDNQAPIPGLDRLSTASITAAAALRDFSPAYRFRQGSTLTIVATNPDLVNWNVNVGIEGWIWSAVEGAQLTGDSPYANG